MIKFRIEELTPKFILRDRTGRALAKGIETALKTMCNVVNNGVDAIINVELMPEWRLDELAWETNCLYDYDADIAQKRRWVADAIPLYRAFGTPSSIVQYLIGYFDDIEVEEWPGYNGMPFHFRVTVSGKWTNKNELWAQKAIAVSKNVRSVMDSLAIGSRCFVMLHGEGAVIARFPYRMTGTDAHSGTWPQTNMIGACSDGTCAIASDAQGHLFHFEVAGTSPEINTIFAGGEADARVTENAQAFVYPFTLTSEDAKSGTHPQENIIGACSDGTCVITSDARGHSFSFEVAGTSPEINTVFTGGEAYARIIENAQTFVYTFTSTSEDAKSGTYPQENTVGAFTDQSIRASPSEASGALYPYPTCGGVCGQEEL